MSLFHHVYVPLYLLSTASVLYRVWHPLYVHTVSLFCCVNVSPCFTMSFSIFQCVHVPLCLSSTSAIFQCGNGPRACVPLAMLHCRLCTIVSVFLFTRSAVSLVCLVNILPCRRFTATLVCYLCATVSQSQHVCDPLLLCAIIFYVPSCSTCRIHVLPRPRHRIYFPGTLSLPTASVFHCSYVLTCLNSSAGALYGLDLC